MALLVWGLLVRGIGVVFVVCFTTFFFQIEGLMGSKSFAPVTKLLSRVHRDLPAPQRYLKFPSLFWLCSKDWFIRGVPVVGLAAAATVVLGGSYSWWALLTCYVCCLTIDAGSEFIYPWDSYLLENCVLAMFMPALLPLWNGAAVVTAPHPLVSWGFRFLFFRMMVGFGKLKFAETSWEHRKYIKFFFINMCVVATDLWRCSFDPQAHLYTGRIFRALLANSSAFIVNCGHVCDRDHISGLGLVLRLASRCCRPRIYRLAARYRNNGQLRLV